MSGWPWTDSADFAEPDSRTRRVRKIRASDMTMRATRWLWQEDDKTRWVPLGGLTLLGGREGVGKTTIAYGMAARTTRGTLPGAFYGTPKSVVIAARPKTPGSRPSSPGWWPPAPTWTASTGSTPSPPTASPKACHCPRTSPTYG
jgi:AAA domain